MPYLIVAGGLLAALLIVRLTLGNVSGASKLELGFAETAGNREVNADKSDWAYYKDELLLVLADGIGSGTKGKTAAKAAVHTVTRVFEMTGTGENPAFYFKQTFSGANSAVLRYIPDATAGTSLLCAVIKAGKLYYALAGNCKILVFRKGELAPLSEGQSIDTLVMGAYERKNISRIDALEAVKEKRVYNFVGKDGFKDLEIFDTPVSLKRCDIIVMLTDGVYDFITDKQIEDILRTNKSCTTMAQQIIGLLEAMNHPEQDNASVILARVNSF